jgi:membrane protease YdiL (CAAX protease family)
MKCGYHRTSMAPSYDLPLAALAWILGFSIVRATGNWLPLAVLAVLAAARLLFRDAATRRLLRPDARLLAVGAAGGALMAAFTFALYRPLSGAVPGLAPATRELYGMLTGVGYGPATIGALVLVVSACEEIVWRGRTLEAPAAHPGGRAAGRAAVIALLYGAAHLPSGSILLALVAAPCGLAWGLLRVAGGSLWPAIVTHAIWDLAILVVWPLARPGAPS